MTIAKMASALRSARHLLRPSRIVGLLIGTGFAFALNAGSISGAQESSNGAGIWLTRWIYLLGESDANRTMVDDLTAALDAGTDQLLACIESEGVIRPNWSDEVREATWLYLATYLDEGAKGISEVIGVIYLCFP